MPDLKHHWEKVYTERKPDEVSWFQSEPAKSLELIRLSGASRDASVIDVGAGASVLVDRLLADGFKNLTVLDLSPTALNYSKARLGASCPQVNWIETDVLEFKSDKPFDLWHDRAVFHFLTEKSDREKYVSVLKKSLKSGGYLILASFAPDGPEKCSNLPVCRYDAALAGKELGEEFKLLCEDNEIHKTPWGTQQKFNYCLFKYLA
jgi:2-polyprenyl-3-methyl-5-hydroxy-6-metoxy-1,4-benzoquinol methylase